MNPILPLNEYVPDVEAKVYSDGKIYLYGSYDLPGNFQYCSKDYYVFSSRDFLKFEKSELAFHNRNRAIPWANGELYAPDCVEKDGNYYLYFCTADGSEGVAVSKSPMGPFENPMPVEGVCQFQIDPTVFIDDDGQAYYYWGQTELHGAKMCSNMYQLDMDSYQPCVLTESEHGFHEGASICKRNGLYYMLYTDISRGRATCLSYAVSEFPLGPFRKGGIVIDNTGCDPQSWNNHGSLCKINNQWYVFYHRSTHNSFFNRRVCVEPVFFDKDGNIPEVEMTLNGQEDVVESTRKLEASRASRLNGFVYIEASTRNDVYEENLTQIRNGDWAEYKYLTFHGEEKFFVEAGSWTYGGQIELHIKKPDGTKIGEVEIFNTGGWNCYQVFSCSVNAIFGAQKLYLCFKGDTNRLFNIRKIWFN